MCPSCKAAEETKGLWPHFDSPKCIWCTARLIQRIGKCRSPTSDEITARRRAVLASAVDWGHSEATIREIVKGPLALEGNGK